MGSIEDAKTPAAWFIEKKDGMTYYYNKVTKETVWDKPIVLCNSQEEIQLSQCPWKETDKDGVAFYLLQLQDQGRDPLHSLRASVYQGLDRG